MPKESTWSAQCFLASLPRCGALLEDGRVRLNSCQQSHKTVDSDLHYILPVSLRHSPGYAQTFGTVAREERDRAFRALSFGWLHSTCLGKNARRWETEAGLVQGGRSSGSRVVG